MSSFPRRIPSVLDNKATFLQFLPKEKGTAKQKNAWFTSLYRYFNLRLATALESTQLGEDESIKKVIAALRWCSSISLVSVDRSEANIISTSKKCRNKFCYLCNRQKSKKLTTRLMKAITEDLGDYTDHYFYFLTLTLKHDSGTRNYDYLSELKDYQNKLFRCKVWKEIFGTDNGIIQAFENSMVKGMHIHSHNMVFAPRIKVPVARAEQMIRDKWLKLTKDSMVIRLDLVGKGVHDLESEKMRKSVMELFKYSTKMSFKRRDSLYANQRLAEWVISSKGKNFTNARGLFRGLQLTGHKSRLDEKMEPKVLDTSIKHYFEKTTKVRFNHSTRKEYSSEERRVVLDDVYIQSVRDNWECSSMITDVQHLLEFGIDEKDCMDLVDHGLIEVRELNDQKVYEAPAEISNVIQMKLFERNSNTYSGEGQKRF